MTQHTLANIGLGLGASGVPALLLGWVAGFVVRKRGQTTTWQGTVRLVGVMFTVAAISISYGITEWNSGHHAVHAGPTYTNPLQGPPPDTGCPDGPLSC